MSEEKKPAVTSDIPKEWSAEEETLAKEALRVLYKHYPGYKWGIEFTETFDGSLGCLVVRLLDIPTQTVYLVHPDDIDRDRMLCVMRGGGMLLEAHGLNVRGARSSDDVRGLITTPSGLIIPNPDAVPQFNPGYESIKRQHNLFNGT